MKFTSANGRSVSLLSLIVRAGMVAASVACAGVVVYVLVMGKWAQLSTAGIGELVVLPVVTGIVLAVAAAKLPNNFISILVMEACLLGFAVLATEVALADFFPVYDDYFLRQQMHAHEMGVAFDRRTQIEVIDDLRAQNVIAYPSFPVGWLDARAEMKKYIETPIYPLSNVSNATIVSGNETGKYLIFDSDEYGFHNPKGLQDTRPVQIAAVGTSFVLGNCVESDQNMVSRIREKYPATLNFGVAFSSALTNLGVFREYVEPLRPRVVLWFVYGEDFTLRDEEKNDILKRYYDPGFSQGLRHRQAEADALLKRALPAVVREDFTLRARERAKFNAKLLGPHNILHLRQLRKRLLPASLERENQHPVDLRPMARSLKLVKQAVARWGGKLYAIYIPDFAEAVLNRPSEGVRFRDVVPLFARLNIPLIDGLSPVARDRDPRRFYPLRSSNHFNAAGYQLMADIIVRRLRADLGKKL